MASKKTEIAEVVEEKKPQTFSEVLTNSLVEVQDGLPTNLNVTKFVNNAVALLNENDTLSSFARSNGTSQIKAGLMRGAFLDLDALNSEFYLVPYGSKLNFSISYRGQQKLCKKYSIRPIKDIYAKVVRVGDDFKVETVNGNTEIHFTPKPFSDADIIGAFAMVVYQDGGVGYEMMTLKELENVRKKSKMASGMAWKEFTSEMYKKTVIHRLAKTIEMDFESAEQRCFFNEDMAINTEEDKPEVIDPFAESEIIDTTIVEEDSENGN